MSYKFVKIPLDNVDIRSESFQIIQHFACAQISRADYVLDLARHLYHGEKKRFNCKREEIEEIWRERKQERNGERKRTSICLNLGGKLGDRWGT